MNITEKFNDGTTNVINLEFKRGKTEIAHTFYPSQDEPLGLIILKSGWRDMYHVLLEYGDMEQTECFWLTHEQIQEKFGVDISNINNVIVSESSIKENPNDQDLGRFVRKMYNNSLVKKVPTYTQLEIPFTY